jgi:hypothetical protein
MSEPTSEQASEPTATQQIAIRDAALAVQDAAAAEGSIDFLCSAKAFEHMQRVAKLFASSELVPQHIRGKVADVFVALLMARELKETPVVVMQSIYFVNGRAAWSAAFVIARANKSGVFSAPIQWRTRGEGKSLVVTAFATLAATGHEASATVSMAMAEAEGWTRNPKYRTMPEHMLRYRAATFLVRQYAPQVLMGYHVVEEISGGDGSRDGGNSGDFPKENAKISDTDSIHTSRADVVLGQIVEQQ